MFYTYRQNNSGGYWTFKPKAGISHFVIIEANSTKNADERAEDIGLYFDGCDDGRDCDCCGDRWSRAENYDETVTPKIYDQEALPSSDDIANVYIHYLDGRIVQSRYKSKFGDWNDFSLSGKE